MAIQWEASLRRFRDTVTGRFVSAFEASFSLAYDFSVKRIRDEVGRFVPRDALHGPAETSWFTVRGAEYKIRTVEPTANIVRSPEQGGTGAWIFYTDKEGNVLSLWQPWRYGEDAYTWEINKAAIAKVARELDLAGPEVITSGEVEEMYILSIEYGVYEQGV